MCRVFIAVMLISCLYNSNLFAGKASDYNEETFAIVTFAGSNVQERSAKALIKSVREFGRDYKNCKIFVVLNDQANFPCESLAGDNVVLTSIDIPDEFKYYPLAKKAFMAAHIEKMAGDKITTLAWFDPSTLVLNSLDELALTGKYKVVIRPVSLANTIGIKPGTEPNDYWEPIYKETGLNYKNLPAYETIVDEAAIQPYFNCEIFSVDPRLGIFTRWAEVLTKFLKDEEYQDNVCNTFLRKLFLHQAVLSCVIMSKVESDRIKPLSIKSGYPFNQHEELSESKQINSLNESSAVIFDYAWEKYREWVDKILVVDPLKSWLIETYKEYLSFRENDSVNGKE